MAGLIAGDSSNHVMMSSGPCNDSQNRTDQTENLGSGWYFSRREIEENAPSRRDGIDAKKEAFLRKSYCTFLQDLGMRLKVPQVTIATAMVFCHRFFLRHSHAKNDRRTIATVCMFLAGKVEETPRPLKDVIIVSYEIINKKDPSAVQKIKQKDVYEQQKELILLGERVVLTTLGFDLNVQHPYKPLVEAIKKFKVAQNSLAQVAWNFVNDGLRTSLCLQFKPHHIAAGAIFLAAKFLKVKLPSEGDKVWWQEFDVTPRQLEDVSNQMLELYEQNRPTQSSHTSEVEGSGGGGTNQPAKTVSTVTDNSVPREAAAVIVNEAQVIPPPIPTPAQPNAIGKGTTHQRNIGNDNSIAALRSGLSNQDIDGEGNDKFHEERNCSGKGAEAEASSCTKSCIEQPIQDGFDEKRRAIDSNGWKNEAMLTKSDDTSNWDSRHSDVITKIDKDKVKAALEKRRKARNDVPKKTDIIDEDDLIERELENGIEMAAEREKTKCDKTKTWPEPMNKQQPTSYSKSARHGFEDNVEEGELSSLEEHELLSPNLQKGRGTGWPDSQRDHKRPKCEIRG